MCDGVEPAVFGVLESPALPALSSGPSLDLPLDYSAASC